MRTQLLNKWIQELTIEIEKAKKEANLRKAAELTWLKEDLIKLRDGPG